MKRIKLIALTLVLIICGAFCLTACGKDNSTVNSIDDARSHYGEIADIMLATMQIEEDDQFHAYYKEQVEDLMEELYTSNFDILDPFIEDVVGQSQIKNSYVSSYLKAVKEFIVALTELNDTTVSLHAKYLLEFEELKELENRTTQQTKRMNAYEKISQACGELFDTYFVDDEGLMGMEYVFFAPILAGVPSVILSSQAVFSNQRNYLKTSEYQTLTEQLQEIYQLGEKIVDLYDYSASLKILFNLVLNEPLMNLIYTTIQDGVEGTDYAQSVGDSIKEIKNSVSQLKQDLQGDKKQAYIDLMSLIVNNSYDYSTSAYYGYDYQTLVSLLENYADKDYAEASSDIADLLDDIGENIKDSALSQKEAEKIVSYAKILDKTGLGFYAEKYASFYAYSQEFVGQVLQSANATDIEAMLRAGLLEDDSDPQVGGLNIAIISRTLANGYESWDNKSEFLQSWKQAMGADRESLLTGTVGTLKSIGQLCPTNSVKALEDILYGENVIDTKVLKINLWAIGGVWKVNDFLFEDLMEAYTEVINYFTPMLDSLESVLGEEYIEQIKSNIPTTDALTEMLEELLADFQ